MLEALGTRKTLWAACLLNLIVAAVAALLARAGGPAEDSAEERAEEPAAAPSAALPAPRFVLLSAAVVGFAFLLMELVWYRMLGPILGGSSFTFGLILAVALLGIGLGGVAYALVGRERPATLGGFALTCALEALLVAVPFALGDWVAEVAMYLRPLAGLGFYGLVLGWTAITLLVVFPAAFVSGVQFPLLIGLLGRGGQGVGRQVGQAYAFNTLGSILGSLAGGFGLLPLLSAPGTWRLCAALLAVTYLSYSLLSVLHQAWGARLGGGEGQRARIVSWREGLALLGVLVASVLPSVAGLGATAAVFAATLAAGVALLAWAPQPAGRPAGTRPGALPGAYFPASTPRAIGL